MPPTGKKTVVITGSDYVTGLGAARALRKLGLQIIGLCADPKQPCARSRFWSRIVTVDGTPDGYVEKLIELGSQMPDRSVLFPSQDEVVQAVSDRREELEEYYDFVLPSKPALDRMMKKIAFHRWAVERGFPVPQSCEVGSPTELDRVLDTVEYPVIIKPVLRTRSWCKLCPVDKVLKLNARAELATIGFDLFEAAPDLLVQQWIPGDDADVHFCLVYYDREGHELAYYTGRKLLQWPPRCGSTAVTVSTVNDDVHRLTQDVFREAEFHGLGSLEVKQSSEDKRYYITEPTVGRNDLQSFLAVGGGVNLSATAYFDAVNSGQAASAGRARRATWLNEYSLPAAIKQSGRFKYRHLLRLLGKRMSLAYFSFADPMPFCHLLKRSIGNKLKKFGGRVFKKILRRP